MQTNPSGTTTTTTTLGRPNSPASQLKFYLLQLSVWPRPKRASTGAAAPRVAVPAPLLLSAKCLQLPRSLVSPQRRQSGPKATLFLLLARSLAWQTQLGDVGAQARALWSAGEQICEQTLCGRCAGANIGRLLLLLLSRRQSAPTNQPASQPANKPAASLPVLPKLNCGRPELVWMEESNKLRAACHSESMIHSKPGGRLIRRAAPSFARRACDGNIANAADRGATIYQARRGRAPWRAGERASARALDAGRRARANRLRVPMQLT